MMLVLAVMLSIPVGPAEMTMSGGMRIFESISPCFRPIENRFSPIGTATALGIL
jgi:hypothetical protein